MKTSSDKVLSSLVAIPLLAALVGIITLLGMSNVKAQSIDNQAKVPQRNPVKLHISAPLSSPHGRVIPSLNFGVRNNKNEWSLTTSLGSTDPVRVGLSGAYTRFFNNDNRVLQPYVRFEAGRSQYKLPFRNSSGEQTIVGATSFSGLLGTRIYPFREGFHLDVAVGPTLRNFQTLSGPPSFAPGNGWYSGLTSRLAVGYDIPLNRKPRNSGRQRVRADLKGQ